MGVPRRGPERERLEALANSLTHADRVASCGVLDDDEAVPTIAKGMAADCTAIAADHQESAADEVITDAGFLVEPTVDALTERLDAALGGARPPTSPADHAQQYDWDAIADQAETASWRAIDGAW